MKLIPPIRAHRDKKGGIELVFTNCTYTVDIRTTFGGIEEKKVLLNNIGGSVKSGHVLAIMGPSGAGKTTLLNMLTCENTSGTPVGNVTLNGNPLTAKYYRDHCAYVRQTDSLWPFMTTYEHVQLAVKLYASEGTNIREQTEFLINSMGLLSCMDTRAKKLSGGQRRRLSLAMAMAKSPEVLFLDEPTSGLDAAAAASIMNFLKVFAAQRNIAILCTIHQPKRPSKN